MKGINPSFNSMVFLTIALTFNAFLLPIAQAQQSSAHKTNDISEGPWLEDGEFVFPEYSNVGPNPIEAQAINDAERDASAHLNKLLKMPEHSVLLKQHLSKNLRTEINF